MIKTMIVNPSINDWTTMDGNYIILYFLFFFFISLIHNRKSSLRIGGEHTLTPDFVEGRGGRGCCGQLKDKSQKNFHQRCTFLLWRTGGFLKTVKSAMNF